MELRQNKLLARYPHWAALIAETRKYKNLFKSLPAQVHLFLVR